MQIIYITVENLMNKNTDIKCRCSKPATTPGQSGPENNGNEEGIHIPQYSMSGSPPSDAV